MTLGKLAKSFTGTRGTLAAAALTGLMAIAPALADDKQQYALLSDNNENLQTLDTNAIAKREARETQSLSLIISHGEFSADPLNKIESPQEFSDGLRNWLSTSNISLRTYYVPNSDMQQDHMSMTFTNGHTSQGPMKPSAVKSNISGIVEEYFRYRALMASASPTGAD